MNHPPPRYSSLSLFAMPHMHCKESATIGHRSLPIPVALFNHGNLSQHVGGHGRQTMVLMPIRHVQYAAEPYRIRVNDKIGT